MAYQLEWKSTAIRGIQRVQQWSHGCYRNLFTIDLRTLALFRISLALIILADLAYRACDLSSMYTEAGALPLQAVEDYYGATWKWSLHLWSDSWGYQVALFVLAGICGLALLVGYHTRIAICAVWIMTASLNTRAAMLMNGGDILLCMGLFWGMFLPLGRRFSVDACRRPPRSTEAKSALSIACVGILSQLAIMYLFTGFFKFNSVWLNGEALEIILSDRPIIRPFGNWLLNFPRLLHYMSQATLCLELVGPLLLFAPVGNKYLRPVALLGFVGLHVGIEMSMTVIMFSYASLAMLTLFIPGNWWNWFSPFGDSRQNSTVNYQTDSAVPCNDQFRWPRWLERLGLVLGSCCIGYIILYNVFTFRHRGSWPPNLARFSQVATLLRFGQQWSMFDQPEKYLSRFAFHGRLKNGDTVDLLRNQVRDRDNPYPESADSFPTQRWMILSRELTASHNFVFRLHVARYLSHQWNQTHSESEQILDGELVAYFDNKSEDFYSIRRQSLAIVDMRDSGPIRFGRRHGKWILRYDNGRKYGEGRYKMGQESGHWIYWNEAGNRDLEGSYVKGRKQGKWTSWEADGRVNRGIYRDDELIRNLPGSG